MSRWRAFLCSLRLTLATIAVLLPSAATAAELRTAVDARRVAVGEAFSVQLTVVLGADDDQPSSPELSTQGAAEIFGPSVSSQRRMMMRNFDVQTETSVVYTWSVTPQAVGQLKLAAPSVTIGRARLAGQRITVDVVAGPPQNGSAPGARRDPRARARSPFGQSPFGQGPGGQDPFDVDPFDLFARRGPHRQPLAPEDLALPSAPDALAFLYARVSKQEAVVGEPVTLEIFAYGSRGAFRELSPTEPALADFLSYPAVETSHEQPVMRTEINGVEYLVLKLRETVLVPLKPGNLEIGSMKAVLRGNGRNYPARGSELGTLVESRPLQLLVSAPPEKGQPGDYQLGDVGRFRLSASLSPRTVSVGEYASLQVEIRGSGNVPSVLQLPEVEGVTWGSPTVKGEIEVKDGELAGSRVLTYTPQFTRAGELQLRTLRLPFYDPNSRRYRTAEVDLGKVHVVPSPQTTSTGSSDRIDPTQATTGRGESSAPATPLPADVPLEPRRRLTSFASARSAPPLSATLALTLLPLATWLLTLLPGWLRKLWAAEGRTPRRKKGLELGPIQIAARRGDWGATAKELERIGYAIMEDHFTLKGRGILRSHLAAELERAGVAAGLAGEVGALFIEMESMRYAASATPPSPAQELAERGIELLRRLDRARAPKGARRS